MFRSSWRENEGDFSIRMMGILHSSWRVFVLLLQFLAMSTIYIGESAGRSYENKRLLRATHCPGQVISWPHRYRTLGARSVLECVSSCGPDVACLAIVFDASDKICYLSNATASENCSNMIAGPEGWKHFETAVSECLLRGEICLRRDSNEFVI